MTAVTRRVCPRSQTTAMKSGPASAVAEKAHPVGAEPFALRGGAGGQLLDKTPEADTMVEVDEMRHLVRDDVIEDTLGREDQAPGKGEAPLGAAASPAARRVADRHPRHLAADA